jgi:hypothetical protein
MFRTLIRQVGAIVLLGSIASSPGARAGGTPPPPPWNPTNEIRIYFAYNPDLLGSYLGLPWHNGPRTPRARAQALVDYLNSVLRASGANVKAAVAGTEILGNNIRHADVFRETWLQGVRRSFRADTLLVLNSTRSAKGWDGQADTGTASALGTLGWMSVANLGNAPQTFAHQMGHALGAAHDIRDNAGDFKPVVPYAVGLRSTGPGVVYQTLMIDDVGPTIDRYSDHEQWYGSPLSSVARYLRERHGRYRP